MRDARIEFQDPKGEGHKGLRLEDVAALLERDFGIKAAEESPGNKVGEWERGRNEPDIRTYARWARVVGKKLDVQILDAEEDVQAVYVPPAVADLAASLKKLREDRVAAAMRIIEVLIAVKPEKVRPLVTIAERLLSVSVTEARSIAWKIEHEIPED